MLNTLQRLNMQQDAPEEQKTFLLKLLDKTLQLAMAPSLKEMFQMAGSKIWQRSGKRLVASSPSLGMTFQAMGEMMLRNKKSRMDVRIHCWLSHVTPHIQNYSS